MTAEDQGWTADNGPDTDNCDLGQHDWSAADDCEHCGLADCYVVCEDCGEEDRSCGGDQ